METLNLRWEEKSEDPQFELYHPALEKGLKKLQKYYMKLDNSRSYILSLRTLSLPYKY